MRIDFTGRQTEVSPELRRYTEERLGKLTRLLRDRFQLHVILTAEKHRERKRRPKPATAVLLNVLRSQRVDHEEHRVLEKDRFPIKPMTVDDAIDTLDATRTGLVVFRNTETERVNVIYRREDGNLGLVEPEP
jgi:putative sigma-54 modulation protein